MGSSYQEERERQGKHTEKIIKAWITSLGSLLTSMVGGLLLIFWEIKYHPSNRQLWMVPFGLILFITPVLICAATIFSDAATTTASSELPSLKPHPALCPETSCGNSESSRSHHVLNI